MTSVVRFAHKVVNAHQYAAALQPEDVLKPCPPSVERELPIIRAANVSNGDHLEVGDAGVLDNLLLTSRRQAEGVTPCRDSVLYAEAPPFSAPGVVQYAGSVPSSFHDAVTTTVARVSAGGVGGCHVLADCSP